MKHFDLSRNPDARFPDSITDVRGFEVRSRDMDEKLGKVDDVICSSDGRIRYLDVDLGGFFNPKHVALPVGIGQVDRANVPRSRARRRSSWGTARPDFVKG